MASAECGDGLPAPDAALAGRNAVEGDNKRVGLPPPCRTDWKERMKRLQLCVPKQSHAQVLPETCVLDKEYFDASGFRTPVKVLKAAQVGFQVPELSLNDLENAIGSEHPVRIIDVATQLELAEDWKLKQWMEYFRRPVAERSNVLNLVSLECSSTKLARMIRPPRVVKDISWVESLWPTATKSDRARMPKVQLYCLMSCKDSYMDCHIDFGGSSVWYHVYRGKKIFFLIPPTDDTLEEFHRWQANYKFGESDFLADHIDSCSMVEVNAGETFLLPSGWIHAVLTPVDSIAFGGNFLTGYHMSTQLRCHGIEQALRVDPRFHFPQFEPLCWYAAASYGKLLLKGAISGNDTKKRRALSKWEWQEVLALVSALEILLEKCGQTQVNDVEGVRTSTNPARICKTGAGFQDPKAMLQSIKECVHAHFQSEPDMTKMVQQISNGDHDQKRPVSSPCPSTTSTSSSSSSDNSDSSSDVSDSSISSDSDSDDGKESDEAPTKDEEEKTGDEDENSGDSSDTSSSSSSSNHSAPGAGESEDDESSSSDSEESELESAYPKLPPAPVDMLIALRKQAKRDELKLTSAMKDQVVLTARIQQKERQERQAGKSKGSNVNRKSSKKKKQPELPFKLDGGVIAVVDDVLGEEEWMVDCLCGIKGKNYDDGTKMVECVRCKNWVHTLCAMKTPDATIPDQFYCYQCEWTLDCACGLKKENYDDGTRMVECEKCKTWQHTKCVNIPDEIEPPDNYLCPRCQNTIKRKSQSSSASKKKQRKSRTSSNRRQTSTEQVFVTRPNSVNGVDKTESVNADMTSIPPPLLPPSPPVPEFSPPPPPSTPPPPPLVAPPQSLSELEGNGRPLQTPSHRKNSRENGSKSSLSMMRSKHKAQPEASPSSIASPQSDGSTFARPPLPLAPKSPGVGSGTGSNGSSTNGKRKPGSARDRLAKKLKMKKSR